MAAPLQTQPAREEDINLYPNWQSPGETVRARWALAASILLHVMAVSGLLLLSSSSGPRREDRLFAHLRSSTKLVAPPPELTQTAPNRGKPSKSVDLDALLPRPSLQMPPSPPSTTRPAAPLPGIPLPAPQTLPLPEPPALEASGKLGPSPLDLGPNRAPGPPQIQAEEKPKLAFEPPKQDVGKGSGTGKLTSSGGSITEVAKALARGGGGGMVVGDIGEGVGGLGEGINLPPSPGRSGSSLELLSDPMGVDFRPYLIQILSAVRRNWFAVMPESAKMGRRGKVVIQFAISRDGNVPKLVIAMSSGADALDRAAVAGVSASNPFPPLPAQFRGNDIRLQFVFAYNMKSN